MNNGKYEQVLIIKIRRKCSAQRGDERAHFNRRQKNHLNYSNVIKLIIFNFLKLFFYNLLYQNYY